MNSNTANTKADTNADTKEVIDFAERLRYVLELKNKQTQNCNAEIRYTLQGAYVYDKDTNFSKEEYRI